MIKITMMIVEKGFKLIIRRR